MKAPQQEFPYKMLPKLVSTLTSVIAESFFELTLMNESH